MHTPYILTRAWPAASLRTLTAAMKPSILPILSTAAARPAALPGWPLLRLGFRPFYLGAAVFACLALPLWLALSLGWVSLDLDLAPLRALHAALAGIVMIECVMAGRVIPAFTNAVTPGLNLKIQPRVEQVTLALTALALAAWVIAAPTAFTATAFAAAAVAHLRRQWSWRPGVTRQRPILWILQAAYTWIPIGFALLAAAPLGWVSVSAGVHALAVGATGGLIIGMVTRTARGHTGRPLVASRAEVLAYGLVMTAAVLRVLLPIVAPRSGWCCRSWARRWPGVPPLRATWPSSRRGC